VKVGVSLVQLGASGKGHPEMVVLITLLCASADLCYLSHRS